MTDVKKGPIGTDDPNRLLVGHHLHAGDHLDSDNGTFKMSMQTDGNLVIYEGGKAIWASGTHGSGGVELTLQADGNLVIRTEANAFVWATGTSVPPQYLTLEDNGNAIISSQTQDIWQSNMTLT